MTSLLGVLALAVLGVLGLRLAARWSAVVSTPFQVEPWLSGHAPTEHALSRYHVRWYTASVVFLAPPWVQMAQVQGRGAGFTWGLLRR